jgi:hypothetical protein
MERPYIFGFVLIIIGIAIVLVLRLNSIAIE